MRTSDPKFVDFMLGWAIRAGKIPAERRPHYEALFARDPDGTTALLDKLAPGLPPEAAATVEAGLPSSWFRPSARLARPTVLEAKAASAPARPSPPAANADALPEAWFPEARERRSVALAAASGRGRVVMAND